MTGFASSPAPTPEEVPIEERIRLRAYELYTQRGEGFGSPLDDWLQAEAEILASIEEMKG